MIKKLHNVVTAIFLLLFLNTNATAQKVGPSVQDMIESCQPGAVQEIYCIGMGSGVSVMMMLNSKTVGTHRICNSRTLSNGQIIRIFLNWADKNPKHWDAPAPIGFALALEQAYPCD